MTKIEKELYNVINGLFKQICEMSEEERAYLIMKTYFSASLTGRDSEAVSAPLRNVFTDWLFSPFNAEAKEKAFERCFLENIFGLSVEPACYAEFDDLPESLVS